MSLARNFKTASVQSHPKGAMEKRPIRKIDAVAQILADKGGCATWDEIYRVFYEYYKHPKSTVDWESGIRGVVYREIDKGRMFKVEGGTVYLLDHVEARQGRTPTNEIEKPEDSSDEPASDLDWADVIDHSLERETEEDDGHITDPWDPALIRVDTRPYSVQQALDMIDEGDLELQPEFQRRRVWKPEQKSLLIESLLLRIPLPTFYLAADHDGHLQVIDGLQRLSTIHEFVRGGSDGQRRFKLNKLQYLQSVVGGKTFEDLKGQVWGRRILQASLIANIVDPQTPSPVKLNIFVRLNKQGTPLSQQELRHAMSGARSHRFLLQLASSEKFHEATGYSLLNNVRMHDVELVLRFCAFQLNDHSSYSGSDSLSSLLTETSEALDDTKAVSSERLALVSDNFTKAMTNARAVFRSDCFRKQPRNPINRALYEVWSYVLGQISEEEAKSRADDLQEVHSNTLDDPQFFNSLSLNTGSVRNVRYRFEQIISELRDKGFNVK